MTEQEKKKELTKKLTDRLTSYQTEITQLNNRLDELNAKREETEKELKALQEEKDNQEKQTKEDDLEIIDLLEKALLEADKVDVQLAKTKNLIEIPPKK